MKQVSSGNLVMTLYALRLPDGCFALDQCERPIVLHDRLLAETLAADVGCDVVTLMAQVVT